MAGHAKDTLGCLGVTQVFYFSLAIPTSKARGAKGLFTSQDGEILNLVTARAAAVSAIVAYQGTVAKEEEVCV